MTGGVVVMLGSVGRNVGAGMTGGIGYFYDADGTFESKVNTEIVKVQRVSTEAGEAQLKSMVERHFEKTGSDRAGDLLKNWDAEVGKFWQIYPPSEADSAVVKEQELEVVNGSGIRVSASAPDGELCFLRVGAQLSPDQTARCAD
uniref:Glutamate synthase alpha subunit C-terminal domain-containing protein n=2 Tax=Cyclophora tenuis TaxID=216820 RepID=A0A7S1D365_CYCTE|mmetsp:Transcript_18168/g.30964  ORF Transcript_18168/g.30964 Transcript_18168/m.30964 type:complete len:145 (+) Transcript_18168:186-620(+)